MHSQTKSPPCLWMQAGVVKKKYCALEYDCTGCRFNRAMNRVCMENNRLRQQGRPLPEKRSGFEFWVDRLRRLPAAGRPCIHTMKGRIPFKSCPKSYHCNDCEFDLYFHDQFRIHTIVKPVGFDDIHGVSMPQGYYFHPGHTWIKIEDRNIVRMGVDDFACRLLGRFDTVTPPLIGEKLKQGIPAVSLLRDRNKVNFAAPVSGVVVEVNPAIKKSPEKINQSPYTGGWICMIYCPDLKQELKRLMFMASGRSFMNREMNRLYTFIEEKTQLKAADGGSLVPDIWGSLPNVPWSDLVKKFITQDV